jgi:hypothetical protein
MPFRDARRFPSTAGYTYAAKVWDLPFSVAPCQTLIVTIRKFLHRCTPPAQAREHAQPP